jgi:hypothetical protein
MNRKRFLVFVVFFVLTSITVFWIGQFLSNPLDISIGRNYSINPVFECIDCIDSDAPGNVPCCTSRFESDCLRRNGIVRLWDMHPAWTYTRGCYQKAPDTGKACASGKECMSGVCYLASGIGQKKCTLIKKDVSNERTPSVAAEKFFFNATYSCTTDKQGECLETIEDSGNPMGINHLFKMDGNTLIEILEPEY